MWLIDENNSNIIAKANVIVTNAELKKKLVEELKNVDTYVLSGERWDQGPAKKFIRYTAEGADECIGFGSGCQHVITYRNPRSEAWKFMNNLAWNSLVSAHKDNVDLLDLFKTIEKGDTREKRLEELKHVREFIKKIENSSLDGETLKEIIKKMWPNFGYVATEVLSCTSIEISEQYYIDVYKAIKENLENDKFEVPKEINVVLAAEALAKTNGKVLSLARQVHEIVNNHK